MRRIRGAREEEREAGRPVKVMAGGRVGSGKS